ncbi:MAG: aminotransferase class V-fold PLP-dependent enzyme [Sphingomonas bacterium]|nr:aminotransferase class V-fold PLP-dependent enzyme [Sphingomonas bacterium]
MDTTRRHFLQGAVALPAVAARPLGNAAAGDPPLLSRRELGLDPDLVYLNTASAGPTPKRILASTIEAWQRLETEPVYMGYSPAPDSIVSAADRVRGKAAALIGCSADEILLTRGTTDGITTLANSIRLKEGDRVLLTDQEHEGGEVGWQHRQRRDGIVVDRVSIPIGDNDTDAITARFAAAIRPRTRVIGFSHVLSPTGLLMPVAEIAGLAKKHGALCIVDGAQAVGAMAVDVRALGCDAYATSGHKWLMGPKGTGFVFISEGATGDIQPPQWFSDRKFGSNSFGLGPMTLAIGLGQAIDDMLAIGMHRVEAHNLALRHLFYAALADIASLQLVSPPPGPLATALVAAALPPGVDSKLMRIRLHDRHRVVLKMAEKRWFNGIRFSPHIFNVEADVGKAMAALRAELGNWQP